MLTHIVFFKLRDRAEVTKAKDALLSLTGKIPTLRQIEVGIDILHSERSYDLALTTKFDSLEGMQQYQTHPEHIKVAEYLATIRESSLTVDYES